MGSLLGRQGWLFDLLTFGRPHQAVAGVAMALLAMAMRRRRALVVALALAAVHAVPLLPASGGAAAAPGGRALRLMTLNVLFSSRDAGAVVELVRAPRPDLLVLQEAEPYWHAALQPLRTLLPYQAPLGSTSGETVLLSRHPFRAEHRREAPGASVEGPPVLAAVDVVGREVAVLAVHARTPRSAAWWRYRNAHLAWLAEAAANAGKAGPVIVAGDFNTPPWSPFFTDFLEAGGLRDAAGGGLSWPTRQPLLLAPWLSWLGAPVDHVTVSPEIEVARYTVGPHVGSDHLPVIADLIIR